LTLVDLDDAGLIVAMIDRLVRDGEISALKGDGCRLRDEDLGSPRPASDFPGPLRFVLRPSPRALSSSEGPVRNWR
jgi:hypothetical protein